MGAMVVLDKKYYIKGQELPQETYTTILAVPINRRTNDLALEQYKGRKRCRGEHIQENVPIGACTPIFCRLPKIHKKDIPIRPTVSSRGTVTHTVATKLAKILMPLISEPSTRLRTPRTVQQDNKGTTAIVNVSVIAGH